MNILHNVVDGANKMEGTRRENSTMQNGMKQKYYPRSNRLHKEQTQTLSGSNEWRTQSCKAKVSTHPMIHSQLNNAMCQRDMHIGFDCVRIRLFIPYGYVIRRWQSHRRTHCLKWTNADARELACEIGHGMSPSNNV